MKNRNFGMLAALLAVLLSNHAAGARAEATSGLTPDEKKLAGYVDSPKEQAIALLQNRMQVDSATENQQGVREVGRLLQSELAALDFAARWIDLPKEIGRAGHLIAEHRGSAHPARLPRGGPR